MRKIPTMRKAKKNEPPKENRMWIFAEVWLSLSLTAWFLGSFRWSDKRPGAWSQLMGIDKSFACRDRQLDQALVDLINGSEFGRSGVILVWLLLAAGLFWILHRTRHQFLAIALK